MMDKHSLNRTFVPDVLVVVGQLTDVRKKVRVVADGSRVVGLVVARAGRLVREGGMIDELREELTSSIAVYICM